MRGCRPVVELAVAIRTMPLKLDVAIRDAPEYWCKNSSVRCLERKESACYARKQFRISRTDNIEY